MCIVKRHLTESLTSPGERVWWLEHGTLTDILTMTETQSARMLWEVVVPRDMEMPLLEGGRFAGQTSGHPLQEARPSRE